MEKLTRAKALEKLKKLREQLESQDADIEAIEAEIQQIEAALENLVDAAEELADGEEEREDQEDQDNPEDDGQDDDHKDDPEERQSLARQRAQLRARVAAGMIGVQVRNFKNQEGNPMPNEYTAKSPEYRSAWLKNIAVRDGRRLLGDMTDAEKRAFTFMTSNTAAVVPTDIQNRIIELVESMAPMLDDAQPSAMTKGFGVPRHKAIVDGDAAVTNEGAANSDEEDQFDLLELTGVEIKKHVKITRKMEFQSIDAFEDWLVQHLGERIAVAKEGRILAQLNNATYGIDAANKLSGQTYADATVRAIMGMIHGEGEVRVYANRYTIWNGLAGIQQGDGTKAFIPNSMVNPEVEGLLYGAPVRRDENLGNGVVYFGIPRRLLANNFDALTVARDTEVTTFVTTIGAYSLFDAGLEDPLSWVKVTFTDAGTLDVLTVVSAEGSSSGKTALTVTGHTAAAGDSYLYKTDENTAPAAVYGMVPDYTWSTWNGSSNLTATTGHKITVVVINGGKVVAAGSTTVTSKA